MSHYLRERRAGYRRCTTTASVLALAAATGLASLAGCGHQTAAARMADDIRVASASAGPADGGSGRHGGAALAYQSRKDGTSAAIDTPSGVSGGALFGGNHPVVPLESSLGRKLTIVRLYYFIGQSFPGLSKYRQVLAGGRTALVSLDSQNTSYAAIAAGHDDAAITAFLTSVNQAAIKYNLGSIYVSFEHEPDNTHHHTLGAPVQFIQAWDHVHQLAESANLDWNEGGRLHWVLILIHNTYGSWRMGSFWPGPSEVDIVAADGYNSYGCGSVKRPHQLTPADTFGPIVSFAAAHGGMPVFLAEWGSDDIPSGEQATYINQMQSFVAANPDIVGALYWDSHVGNCNYKVDGNAGSINALAAMGHSAALQGHV
jgi:hypothetical protein